MKGLKDRIKSAWHKIRYKSITAYSVGLAVSILTCALYYLIFEGTAGLADWITGNAIFTVVSCVFIDVFVKLFKRPTLIVWQYWILIGGILMAVASLIWAFGCDTVKMQYIGLAVTAFIILLNFACCHWLYGPAMKKRNEENEALAIKFMHEKLGIPHSTATSIVQNDWVGAEIEASIVAQVTGEVK